MVAQRAGGAHLAIGTTMGENIGGFIGIAFALLSFAGWCQHLYTCFNEHLYGFLIAGAIFFPIAIIHGWGIWFGWWG
jgi:hypothetical protein